MALKYIKGSGHLVGVPSRDLSDDEIKKYGGIKYLVDSGKYKKIATEKKESK